MYLKLKPYTRLRKEKFGVILYSGGEVKGQKVMLLNPLEAIVLTLFDGSRTSNEVVNIVSYLLNMDEMVATNFVERVVSKSKDFLDETPRKDLRCTILYNPEDFAFSIDKESLERINKRIERFGAPISLGYILTKRCHLRCKYCYADSKPLTLNEEKHISFDRLVTIFNEAHDIGVVTVLLTGGEPLLRHDLPKIIRLLVKKDFYVHLPTKAYLTERKIKDLKDAGLEEIQISIDSHNPSTQDFLSGVNETGDKLLKSIETCVKYGIKVKTNSVITSYNIKDIPELLIMLSKIGVSKAYLSPYTRSLGRHDEKLFPSLEDYVWLYKQVDSLRKELCDFEIDDANLLQRVITFLSTGRFDRLECGAGRTGLVMLPDGRVTICERLADDDRFIVGDLKTQSIMEIWNSEKLNQVLYPSKEHFQGKKCYSCLKFTECVNRGICYVRAMIVYGTPYAPDPICGEEKLSVRIF